MIAAVGIGNAAVPYRPVAQLSCLLHFLFARKEVGLEANAKKNEYKLRL